MNGLEYYINTDARGVLEAGDKVHKSTEGMRKDFETVDNAVKELITKQVQLGSTVNKTGQIVDKFGNVNKGATNAVQQLIAKQNQLKESANRVDDAYIALNKANQNLNKGFKSNNQLIQQAGYQIGDFAVQVQGGQNAIVAFNQQFSQLAGFLGPKGAVIGGISAVAGAMLTAFIPSLKDSSESTQDLIDKLKELSETKILSPEQSEFLAAFEKKSLNEKTKAIQELEEKIKSTSDALQRATLAEDNVFTGAALGGAAAGMRNTEKSAKDLSLELKELKALLATTRQEWEKSKDALNVYEAATKGLITQTDDQKESVKNLIDSLVSEEIALKKGERGLLEKTLETFKATDAQKKAALATYDAIKAAEDKARSDQEAQRMAEQQQNAYDSLLAAYQREVAQLELNKQQLDEYNARQKLGLDDKEKLPEAIQAEIDKLEELRQKQAEIEEQKKISREVETQYNQIVSGLDQQGDDPFEALMQQQEQEREIINQHYANLLSDKQLNAQDQVALEQQKVEDLIALGQRYADAEAAIEAARRQQKLQAVSQTFGALSSLMNTESKKLFEIGKAAAIASAIVDGYAAVQKTMASVPYPFNIPLAAAQAAASAAQVQGIAKQKIGGAQSAGASQSFSGGTPVTNTSSAGGGATRQVVSLAGIDANSLVTGSQVLELLKNFVGDGGDVSFLTQGG